MSVWEYRCYASVSWKQAEDHFLVAKPGWARFSSLSLALFIPLFLVPIVTQIVDYEYRNFRQRERKRQSEEKEAERLRSILFPFFTEEAQFFVGPRYPWMEKKEQKVSQNDIGSIAYHLKGVIYAICSFIKKKPAVKLTDDKIDFSKSLIASGGPIPNWYVRNLMYG